MATDRYARMFVWLDPSDCDPPHSLDLSPGSRDSYKVEWLTEAFARDGFDPDEPVLVGYPLHGRVQLLTGTHRHEAARRAGIRLPVRLILRSVWSAAWGTPRALDLTRDIPLAELSMVVVTDGSNPVALDDMVEPERDLRAH